MLIIRLTSMGDVVLVTSLLSYLHKRDPSLAVSLATDERFAGLFASDPRLDMVYGIPRGAGDCPQLPQSWGHIVDLQGNRRSRKLRATMQAERISTFDKLHAKRWVLLLTRLNTYREEDHVCTRYVQTAGYGDGLGGIPSPRVCVGTADGRFRAVLPDEQNRPLLGLMPFSAWKNKEWPLESFAEVGRTFASGGWSVLVFGSGDDRRLAASLQERIGEHCRSIAGELTLAETVPVLKRCRLALGNDTGMSHLARASGVKTGIIFGSTTRHFGFFPFGDPPFRVFETAAACRPCSAHGGNHCIRLTRPCLGRIAVDQVVCGLRELNEIGDSLLTSTL